MASAQVQITQLPSAGTITGSEAVPIVQNGVTVQTTTGAIAASPTQTQTFLTKNLEPTLPNSRYFSTDGNFSLTDGGAQSYYRLNLTGIVSDLTTIGTGVVVKDASDNLVARTLTTSGGGLGVTNGDGVSGNPTFALNGITSAIANIGVATGLLSIQNGTTATAVNILGTTNQIAVANGNGTGNPTIAISDNPVLSGTEGFTVPAGTSAQRPASPNNGEIRYNTSLNRLEAYVNGAWTTVGVGDGTVTSVTGTANQISVVNGTTTPVVSIASNPTLPGTSGVALPSGTTAQRTGTPSSGTFRYNTSTGLLEYYGVSAWTSLAAGSGVTSVATGTGLTGGPITSTGTISIDTTGVTAGSYGGATKTLTATVNAQGQLTALAETPIAITNTQVSGLGTMSTQNASAVAVTGGTINATSIGATTPSTGVFSSVGMTTGTITTAPASGTDIVNKDYADSIASGINFHAACNYASTADLGAATYNNGSSGVGATLTKTVPFSTLSVDGGSPTVGQRILVKNQTSGAQNGIYVVTSVGSALVGWVLTRATDYDTSGSGQNEIDQGDYVLVLSGTTQSNTSWVQQTALPITVGTTSIVWLQFGAPITYSAGTGLTLSTTTFSITNTAVTSGSYGGAATVPTFSVNAQGQLTAASNTTIAIAGSQITSGTVAIANGGTGQTTAAAAITALTGAQTSAYYLRSNGTNATLSALSAADLTGTVAIASGGTGQTTASAAFNALSPVTTTGDLIIGNGTNSATRLAIGANGYLLTSNGTTASWVAAPASGVTSFSAGTTGLTPATGTTGAVTLAGTLAIANGGTNGSATPTAGGASYGTGTAYAFTAAGTAGQVLTSAGTSAPVWSGISGGTF